MLGQSAGHAYLRIVEPGTDILLDRVDVRVAAVAAVHVTTVLAAFSSAADDEITAVWTGARAQLVVTLVDASGGVLWDDSLEVAGHPSTLVQVPVGLELTAVAPASGTLALMLVRDAATHPVSLPVVSSATGIALFPDDATIELTLGTTTFFCALGRTATGLIAGAPVAATHPAGVSDAPDAIPQIDGVPVDGCVGIRGDALGLARVTISIGAQATDVAVTVVPGAVPLEGPAIDLGHLHGWTSAGERLRD